MDEIKRKLIRIETQLHRQSLPERVTGAAPLFFPAVGLMVGIVTQHVLATQMGITHLSAVLVAWSILLALSMISACLRLRRSFVGPSDRVTPWVVLLCFVCLGGIRLTSFQAPSSADVQRLVGDERTLATIRGRLVTAPRSQPQQWCFAQFAFTDPPSSFYLTLDQIETDRGWRPVRGMIRVQVDEPTPALRIGDAIEAYCWLYRFGPPTNPGQFDLATHLRRRNVHVGASVPGKNAIEVRRGTRVGLLTRTQRRLSQAAARALLSDQPHEAPSQGLLEALLLGDRRRIDRSTYEAFQRTGLLHLISLSGMHLGILMGILWWIGKAIGLMKPRRAILCMLATVLFLMIVPARAPTVRAAVIVWAFGCSILLRRRSNPLNALSLAAIVLLLYRPTQLFEAGWQLSFAAVTGILALTAPIEEILHTMTRGKLRPSDRRGRLVRRLTRRIGASYLRLFSAGLAAWIGGAGILLYHFHAVTPLASVWTVLVFPLVVLILAMGFLKIALFFLLPTLSHLLGVLVTAGADVFIWIVQWLARPGINHILIGHVPGWIVILYYTLVLIVVFTNLRSPLLKRVLCISLALVLVGYVGISKWRANHRSDLILTCLDVGHGQAIVLQPPGSGAVLFDAGSMFRGDVGSRIVLPYLDYAGVRRLDAIVVSHNDIDHINGLPEVAAGRDVEHVYANAAFFDSRDTTGTARRLAHCLSTSGHTIEPIPRSLTVGAVTIETLWPPVELAESNDLGDNDRSLVTRVQFGGVSILLCSDIEVFAQQQIMEQYPNLTAQIVVVPHHGSKTTQYDPFLASLAPEITITSCSRKRSNSTPHAHSDSHTQQFSTAANGAVTVCVERDGMVLVSPYVENAAGD